MHKISSFLCKQELWQKVKKEGATLLTPPNHLVHHDCLVCASELKTHNDLGAITIFTIDGCALLKTFVGGVADVDLTTIILCMATMQVATGSIKSLDLWLKHL